MFWDEVRRNCEIGVWFLCSLTSFLMGEGGVSFLYLFYSCAILNLKVIVPELV